MQLLRWISTRKAELTHQTKLVLSVLRPVVQLFLELLGVLVQERGAAAPVLLEAVWLKSVVTPRHQTAVGTSQPESRQEELKRERRR